MKRCLALIVALLLLVPSALALDVDTNPPEGVLAALEGQPFAQDEVLNWLPNEYEPHLGLLAVGSPEAITVCLLIEKDGVWTLDAFSDSIIPADYDQGLETMGSFNSEDAFFIQLNNSEICMGNDYSFRRNEDGEWEATYVTVVEDTGRISHRIFEGEGGWLIRGWDDHPTDPTELRTVVYTTPSRLLADFDAAVFVDFLKESLANRDAAPEIPLAEGAGVIPQPLDAFADPLSVLAGATVYSGPGDLYAQTAGAALPQEGWLQIFGQENGWFLVQYPVGDGQNRFGYVQGDAGLAAAVPALEWMEEPYVATIDLTLTDDPLRGEAAVADVPAGTVVRRLASLSEYWSYVEVEATQGAPVRGFLFSDFLVPEGEAALDDEVSALIAYWQEKYPFNLDTEAQYEDAQKVQSAGDYYQNGLPDSYDVPLPDVLRTGIEQVLAFEERPQTVENLARVYTPYVYYLIEGLNRSWYVSISPIDPPSAVEPYTAVIDTLSGDVIEFHTQGNG